MTFDFDTFYRLATQLWHQSDGYAALGLTAVQAASWANRGFMPNEAAPWANRFIGPAEAVEREARRA